MLAQATPAPSQELNALLTHPLMLIFGTLLAAWLATLGWASARSVRRAHGCVRFQLF